MSWLNTTTAALPDTGAVLRGVLAAFAMYLILTVFFSTVFKNYRVGFKQIILPAAYGLAVLVILPIWCMLLVVISNYKVSWLTIPAAYLLGCAVVYARLRFTTVFSHSEIVQYVVLGLCSGFVSLIAYIVAFGAVSPEPWLP